MGHIVWLDNFDQTQKTSVVTIEFVLTQVDLRDCWFAAQSMEF